MDIRGHYNKYPWLVTFIVCWRWLWWYLYNLIFTCAIIKHVFTLQECLSAVNYSCLCIFGLIYFPFLPWKILHVTWKERSPPFMGLGDNDQKELGKYAFLSFRNDADAVISHLWIIFAMLVSEDSKKIVCMKPKSSTNGCSLPCSRWRWRRRWAGKRARWCRWCT